MHVYGELSGNLISAGRLHGMLVSDYHKIQGTLTIPSVVGAETYDGPYEVTPKAWDEQVLETAHKLMTDDVTVFSRSVVTPDLTVCSFAVQSYLALRRSFYTKNYLSRCTFR